MLQGMNAIKGSVFLNGEKIGDEVGIEHVTCVPEQNVKELCDFPLNSEEIANIAITFKGHLSPWVWLYFITGKWPTNNWLKINGGIMERKVQIAKARKLMRRRERTRKE